MNQDTIKTLVSQMAGTSLDMKKMEKLIQLSSRAMELIQMRVQTKDPAKLEELHREIMECHKELTAEYEKVLSQLGLTKDDLMKFMANPQNFSKTQWDMIDGFKKKLEEPAAPVKEGKKKTVKPEWLSA